MMFNHLARWLIVLFAMMFVLHVKQTLAQDLGPLVRVDQTEVVGHIEGTNFTCTITMDVVSSVNGAMINLISGDVVIQEVIAPANGYRLYYNTEQQSYRIFLAHRGAQRIEFKLAARAVAMEDGAWHEVKFKLPTARKRPISITADRTALNVALPGAVRVERAVVDGKLTISGIQGAAEQFSARWKPQVQELEAKLVVSSQANTIATVSSGGLRVDTLFVFDVAQGKLEILNLYVPASLSITQVRGNFIRDWHIQEVDSQGPDQNAYRKLVVVLNRPQTSRYGLQVLAEAALGKFPAEVDLPVISPLDGIRASGHLAVGTQSAIAMMVQQVSGLSQIDGAAMPRMILERRYPRPLPSEKAFYYAFAASPYQAKLVLDRIVPAYDIVQRVTANVDEDDLTLKVALEMDVRDAPMRSLELDVPLGFTVVSVSGAEVEDYRVLLSEMSETTPTVVRVDFKKPVIGRALLEVRLELGRSPLDEFGRVGPIVVHGAQNQRGYVVVAVADGLIVDSPQVDNLRQINTASAPLRVANAQYAYRFRSVDWSLQFKPTKKPAGIRVEAFELISLGEGIAYGNMVANYFITGSPVDSLEFVISPKLENIQFVGSDVRRWFQDEDDPSRWTVTLQRKVVGDYNLGVSYSHRYQDDSKLLLGGVYCVGVQTQVGYLAVASHLNLKLTDPGGGSAALIMIDRDEMPSSYRLLVNAPLLRSYKYVESPHEAQLQIDPYERGSLTPVVIELSQIKTQVVPREDGASNSFTTLRYKIKNSSSQFITLKMPARTSIWSVRLVERVNGQESKQRISASFDTARDELLIPLQRPRDPNAPITVEVEYGQVHDALDWAGHMDFAAPVSDVRSTYDNWTVTVAPGWSVHPRNGTMKAQARTINHGDLGRLGHAIASSWASAWHEVARYPQGPVAVLVFFFTVLILLLVARGALLDTVAIMALLAVLFTGIMATNTSSFGRRVMGEDNLTTIEFTQVIDLNPDTSAKIGVTITPTWRQYYGTLGAIVVPIVGLVCLVGSRVPRKGRAVLGALGLAGLLYGASRWPALSPMLGHLMTWGLPLVLLVWYIWRVVIRSGYHRPLPGVVTAGLLLLVATLGTAGCATTPAPPAAQQVVLDDLHCQLTAERDSMAGRLELSFTAGKPLRFALLEPQAIVLSTNFSSEQLKLSEDAGHIYLVAAQKGRYKATIEFLLPLAPANEQQLRNFSMPLPTALAKGVDITIARNGIDVHVPTAITLDKQEQDAATQLHMVLGPNDDLKVFWKPRDRRRELEETVFFTSIITAVRFDAGIADARHHLHFEIAQGQLTDIRIELPRNMTVTAVEGEALGAWRFDPISHELEARLSKPATGEYRMRLVTQMVADVLPLDLTIGALRVKSTIRQRGAIGILTGSAVDLTISEHPQLMNVDDFSRDGAALLEELAGSFVGGVRYAYRMNEPTDQVVARVFEVQPEIRTAENAGFTVSDDRLVYNSRLNLSITKAGLFSVGLYVPEGFDIDTLEAQQVSHWDEVLEDGRRLVTVHLRAKTLGQVSLNVALSRPISQLPARLEVPRVEVAGALKHSGRLTISAERGVRLTVAQRSGVSELNPTELGMQMRGALAFGLLRPDWQLTLQTEVIQPRVIVDSLHVAKVGEGVVRHTYYLRYKLHHAGAKVFQVQLPGDALGVMLSGPDIARRHEVTTGSGRWQVELSGKWYDRPYPLTVRFETRFDRSVGEIKLKPIQAVDADLQRGTVAVLAGDRVEIDVASVSSSLQVSEARTIPASFGGGDLSNSVLCYRSSAEDYLLVLQASRHDPASLLEAEVEHVILTSVVTVRGETINRLEIQLRVDGKRHLKTILPTGGQTWSLLVNGRSVVPAIDRSGSQQVLLVPLAQSAAGDLPVTVELVYVVPAVKSFRWSAANLVGPQFDLPLRDMRWKLYLPEGYDYDNFQGTLELNESRHRRVQVARYDAQAYEQEVVRLQTDNINKAIQWQARGNELAVQGKQRAAKQALESALHYSLSDVAFNEDARVQLHRLNNEQALVGLVGSRGRLRQHSQSSALTTQGAIPQLDEQFSRQQVERIRSSLSKADSENLDIIIKSLIDTQEAAAGSGVPLVVSMPLRGRVMEFNRPIQVEPNAKMELSFTTKPAAAARYDTGSLWGGGVFLILLLVFAATPHGVHKLAVARKALRRRPQPQQEPPTPDEDEEAMDEDFQ